MRNTLFWLAAAGAAVIFGFFVLCAGFTLLLEIPVLLAFGWWLYLAHVIPHVRPDAGAVFTAGICLVGVTLGTHTFLGWLHAASTDAPRRWRWKWSLQLVGLVVLMFAAGIAFTGIVHQTSWLVRSPEPLFRSSREAEKGVYSSMNLKQIGLAAWNYHDNQTAPQFPRARFSPTGQPMHSWQTAILPYIEQDSLYKLIDLKKPWSDPANAMPMGRWVKMFTYPGYEVTHVNGFGVSHYAGNVHVVLSDTPRSLRSFPAGVSNTVLAGEVNAKFCAWGDPLNARDPALGATGQPHGFGGPNGRPAQFVMLDGSVRTFDPKHLAELSNKPPE